MTDQEAFAAYVAHVDSPENQALPEAERLPMVAGWVFSRPFAAYPKTLHRITNDEKGYGQTPDFVTAYDPEPIDIQAACGVLAGWLGLTRTVVRCGRVHTDWFLDSPSRHQHLRGAGTLLAAQVAAAGSVLGVKG